MKKVFLLAATAAVALSSCSKNEVSEIANPNDNPNAIGLSVGTFATKSAEANTAGLNTENNVLKIYTADTDFGTSGIATFTCGSNNDWTVSDSKTWKDVGFPLSLYSMNNGTQASGDVAVDPATGKTCRFRWFGYTNSRFF